MKTLAHQPVMNICQPKAEEGQLENQLPKRMKTETLEKLMNIYIQPHPSILHNLEEELVVTN